MKKLLYTTILVLLACVLSLAQGIAKGNADNLSTEILAQQGKAQ